MANSQTFQQIAAGCQSIVTIIALGIGGWWTYKVFEQTKQTAAAEERLATERWNLERGRADAERQRRIDEAMRAIIPMIDVVQLSQRPRRILVKLKFVNPGDQEQRLAIADAIFSVRQVRSTDQQGVSSLGRQRRFILDLGDDEFVKAIVLPAGGEQLFEAIQQLPSAGVYDVRFTIEDPKRSGAFYDLVQYINVR